MGIVEKYLRGRVALSETNQVDLSLNDQCLNTVIAYNKYGAYCVPVSTQNGVLARKILRGEVFEPDTIEFMRSNVKEGDIIHSGACFGDFFPGLSTALQPDSRIWTFEPSRESFRCAEITLLLNNITNVNLFPTGLGEKSAQEYLNTQNKKGVSLGGSSSIGEKSEIGQWDEIEIVAIDEVIPANRNISILQLDIEGYEEQALKGALKTIKRCRPILILEDDQKITQSDWFKSNVLSLDYQIDKKLHYNRIIMPKS